MERDEAERLWAALAGYVTTPNALVSEGDRAIDATAALHRDHLRLIDENTELRERFIREAESGENLSLAYGALGEKLRAAEDNAKRERAAAEWLARNPLTFTPSTLSADERARMSLTAAYNAVDKP